MSRQRRRVAMRLALVLAALAYGGDAFGLIAGRDAETEAARGEKEGKFREAAVWRLFAARAYRELIIPFEVESVRAFTQSGQKNLAEICANRAEVLYPPKVRENLALYEQDLQKAGGDKVRADVLKDVSEMMVKYAPIPLSVPSRLTGTEDEEKKGNWPVAADYRELAARMYLLVTVPVIEKESDAAKDPKDCRRYQVESLKYLKLAREEFAAAGANYRKAAGAVAAKGDAQSGRLRDFRVRKAAEMDDQVEFLLPLIRLKANSQKSWAQPDAPRDAPPRGQTPRPTDRSTRNPPTSAIPMPASPSGTG